MHALSTKYNENKPIQKKILYDVYQVYVHTSIRVSRLKQPIIHLYLYEKTVKTNYNIFSNCFLILYLCFYWSTILKKLYKFGNL